MAPPKRKRIPTRDTANKRPIYAQPDTSSSDSTSSNESDGEDSETSSQKEWEALRITAQSGQGFGVRYLIEWAGIDPATGKQWEPSWVKAANASEGLRNTWKRERAQKARESKKPSVTVKSGVRQQGTPAAPPAQATESRGAKQRNVTESAELSSSAFEEELSAEITQDTPAVPNSATFDIGASVPDATSFQVAVDAHSGSLSHNEHELHVEILESQLSSPGHATEDTDLESSQLFASQAAFRASGIIPDTQSSAGDVSYIPVTQEDLESSVYSDNSDESGDHVVGYSGLLDADEPPTLDLRAQSPATSIAETVADTPQELHSQRQFESQQEQPAVPETSVSSSEENQPPIQDEAADCETEFASAGQSGIESQQENGHSIAFVENTTHLEDSSVSSLTQDPQQPASDLERRFALARNHIYSRKHSSQALTSLEQSQLEPPAIAETPQITQLTPTTQAGIAQQGLPQTTEQPGTTRASIEHATQASLIELTVLEENAQFAFHSQRPTSFDPRSAPTQRALTEPPRPSKSRGVGTARHSESPFLTAGLQGTVLHDSEESTTIDENSQPLEQGEPHFLIARGNHTSHSSPSHQGEGAFDGGISGYGEIIGYQAGAVVDLSPLSSTEDAIVPREQNAQLVPSCAFLATEELLTERVLAALSEAATSEHSSPCSRHDSSQENPERQLQTAERSSSPIPHPPSYSLGTSESKVPSRPVTPLLTSSSSRMADPPTESSAEYTKRRLEELKAIQDAKNPYIPRWPPRLPQAPVTPGVASSAPIKNVSAEGTRSPSTVPDRSPAPPVQTSLRTVAFANAKDKVMEPLLKNALAVTATKPDAGPSKEKAELVAAVASGVESTAPDASTELPEDDSVEEMANDDQNVDYEDDGDDESQYNEDLHLDDLHLEKEEYIVPLFINGRQRDTYTAYLEQKTDLLNTILDSEALMEDPTEEKLNEVEKVLTHLKAIENHLDLTYAEAESATGSTMRSAADVEYGAQFGIDNSIKFKFLGELFNHLRKRSLHIVILLDQDNTALLNIVRTFLAAAAHNYSMPTKAYLANASNDTLKISVFARSTSPVIQRADLVICLDGVQDATEIRQRNWARASGKTLPVLHLVISQTVGHIERYMLPNMSRKTRIANILTVLGQIEARNEVGNQIDIDTPSATEAAKLVASWLGPDDDQEEGIEWPLPSIGSARNFIEYDATQQSVRSAASSPAPERAKRPLDTDEPDTAKRMRYTPQAHVVPNSSTLQEPDLTRINDSISGLAAAEHARLAASHEQLKSELLQVQRERREEQVMWDRQQTEHENRQQQYRKLFTEKAEADRAYESMTKNRDKIRSHVDVQATELRTLRAELDAQRNLSLASTDDNLAEMTRLRKELEATRNERDKALNSVQVTEKTLEYTKEQYRDASNAAGQLRSEVTILEAENARLSHQASGEVAKLKKLHLDASSKNAERQIEIYKQEIVTLKAALKQRDEELIRAKNNSGRAAYGTRAQSTTPQPKIRSRAASPERGARAPRGGGRIHNLVAEER